ncbi:YqgE/AlgH family protein [Haoranjiania flava]|uniref:YqgE/AlgH family protein n=1 Tax=Haoranjiania flava TaxID=1856322 RepID=A0AAE3IK15_9BACT|nr:YqgE/AlgH family protein [Haoranjiania flava]MCU7693213.1 YqgE/AlgH family protein [Haoranjiania flava]
MQIPAGKLLISDPFLQDPYFQRTVIFICESDESGSLGFVVNKLFRDRRNKEFSINGSDKILAYYGGPVAPETLHFIHSRPDLIEKGVPVTDNIFWSGDYDKAMFAVENNLIKQTEIKFFLGYSGWDPRQLEDECNEKTWIIQNAAPELVFHSNPSAIWKMSMERMGGEYKMMSNFPTDPQLN